MAHVIAFLDLAQSRPYPPSASQGSAPNGPTRLLTLCPTMSFCLDHKACLSQSAGPQALENNLRPIHVRDLHATKIDLTQYCC